MEDAAYHSLVDSKVESFRKEFRKNTIPRHYSPVIHLGINFLIIFVVVTYHLLQLKSLTFLDLMAIPLGLLFGNIFVYFFHKHPLHHPTKWLPLAYKIHTKMHHHFFTNKAIIYKDPRDFYILFFPISFVLPVNGIFLPAIALLIKYYFPESSNLANIMVIMGAVYLCLYEFFHFISHLPENHFLLRINFLKYQWKHHTHHHNHNLMGKYNFNIVFPLCDKIFKTHYNDE